LTRRDFIWTIAAPAFASSVPARVQIPIHRIVDAKAQWPQERIQHFWWSIWPEAARTFANGGIDLQTTDGPGEIRHTAGDRPIFIGLRRGVMNLVVTDHIPMLWDNARALAGVATLYEAYPLCLIALRYAHGNQIPFLSVNTCVHELLHAFLQDIFVTRPSWFQSASRESRIDSYATGLWLFHNGSTVRKFALGYLERVRSAAHERTSLNLPAGK
jgi:hypothetical protein